MKKFSPNAIPTLALTHIYSKKQGNNAHFTKLIFLINTIVSPNASVNSV